MAPILCDKAKIIQIDIDSTPIGRRHPVTIGAVGQIKASLEALLPRLEQHENNVFLAAHLDRFDKDRATAEAKTVSGPDAAISGTYLTKMINKHAAADALFAADDGTAAVWMLRHRAASVGPLPAYSTARWRAGCLRRSGCRRANLAGR
jgi:pyruvate dehydrogenase (quinone)